MQSSKRYDAFFGMTASALVIVMTFFFGHHFGCSIIPNNTNALAYTFVCKYYQRAHSGTNHNTAVEALVQFSLHSTNLKNIHIYK